jgi:hypothetical protein
MLNQSLVNAEVVIHVSTSWLNYLWLSFFIKKINFNNNILKQLKNINK